MEILVIVGSFSDGERVLGRADSIDKACLLVQEKYQEYFEKGLQEIWYESVKSWKERRNEGSRE